MRRLLLLAGTALLTAAAPPSARSPEAVGAAALKAAPVWDGHNDVPEQLRERRKNIIADFDFRDTSNTADQANKRAAMQTDLIRLRQGRVGAQFWSVYVSTELSEPQAVQATLEQIDLIRRLVARYPAEMQLATSAVDVEAALKAGKIASLIGMEGGHSIGGSLGVLRQMYALGARYMTLAHYRNNAWADSANDKPVHGGLTDFGRDVVREMQRLGMLVDLSHVSEATMFDTLEVARAPVIFSHSNARAVNTHPRNVADSVLDRVKVNGGIVMVNAYPGYISENIRQWNIRRAAEQARTEARFVGDPAGAEVALAEWEAANPAPTGGISDVANHIDHIARRAGIDHVGLGGDYDGIDVFLQGMEDVSTYPALFTELARRGYSQSDLEKIASRNMMRVKKAAEAHAAAHRNDPPIESATSF